MLTVNIVQLRRIAKPFVVPASAGILVARFRLKAVLQTLSPKIHSLGSDSCVTGAIGPWVETQGYHMPRSATTLTVADPEEQKLREPKSPQPRFFNLTAQGNAQNLKVI